MWNGSLKLWNGKEVSKEQVVPFSDEKLFEALKCVKGTEALIETARKCSQCRENIKEFVFMHWGRFVRR